MSKEKEDKECSVKGKKQEIKREKKRRKNRLRRKNQKMKIR